MKNKELNTQTICLYCGKDKSIFPLIHLKKPPEKVIIDYEPCSECKKRWNEGVPVLEVTHTPTTNGQPSIGVDADGKSVYPTGAYMVLSPSLVEGKIGEPTLCKSEDFRKIFNDIKKAKEQFENGSK